MDRDTRYWLEQGEAAARNPNGWLYAADALKRSADAVLAASDEDRRELVEALSSGRFPSIADELADVAAAPFLWPVYLQLAGLAIENLAKGISVATDPSVAGADERGRLVSWGHISRKLFDELGIQLDDDEGQLVERLAVYVDWAGRYPVPRFAQKLAGERSFRRAEDAAAINALFERLRSELQDALARYGERGEQERRERGLEAMRALATLPKQTIDGAALVVAEGEPEEPAAVVVCGACGQAFSLSPNHPAAFCNCGHVHWYELTYDGSLGRDIPLTRTLYSDERKDSEAPNSRSAQASQ